MKILFVSMPCIHTIRWIENLKDTSFEMYLFDVLGRGELETINTVHQFTDWKKRKIPYIKGEYFLSKNLPSFYNRIQPFLEVSANAQLEKIIKAIQPDIIHSFEMQGCSYPILKTMNKFPNIKWIYSCWGNDLFYYKKLKEHYSKIKKVLNRVNYIHADCYRDFDIAKELGFKGDYLGVIPTGGGFRLNDLSKFILPLKQRKTIVVKGYQHQFGRGLKIVQALKDIQSDLIDYDVVVFGAHREVIEFIKMNKLSYTVFDRHGLKHEELLELMGQSLIYIGNSISDGMPNALLEAIAMGAFPVQSNPGGATAEIINHGVNGFLIENPESVDEIQQLIKQAISDPLLIEKAREINYNLAKQRLDYEKNKSKIIAIYDNQI